MKFEIEKLEAFLQDFAEQKQVPGMSVCVNGPEGSIYKKGFGFCDAERTQPADPDTIYGIGSTTKNFVCTCLAILESEGKLSFRDPVCKYFPALKVPGTPRESLLLWHLATMTSGFPPLPPLLMSLMHHSEPMPRVGSAEIEMGRKMIPFPMDTIEEVINFISNNSAYYDMLGAPGEYMSYFNDGYALLSAVVEIVSGLPLGQFAHARIFAPLGMTRTTFDTDAAKAMGNITSLFNPENGGIACTDVWPAAPPFDGAGFLKSSVEDLSKYFEMLACGGIFRGKRILPEGCVARLCGREFPETAELTYCCGLMKRVFRDVVICEHLGSITGVSSISGFFKDKGYSASVLMNLTNVNSNIPLNAVYNMLLGLPIETSHAASMPQGDAPEKPGMYVGTYISIEPIPPSEIQVTMDENGALYMEENGIKGKLLFCDKTTFIYDDGKETLEYCPRVTFYVRNGKAWGLHHVFRMFRRDISVN